MQNLLKILLRYSNFLVFIALEVAAFLLVSYNNAYPRSSLLSTANDFVAWQNEVVSEVRGYFSLRSQNEQLAIENADLRNQIGSMKSGEVDTTFHYQPAKVVQMTTDRLHNYLTINLGSKDGIQRGQGVRNEEGVVGIVRTVGRNYSVVLPIINTHTNLSCRFSKNDYIGTLQWDLLLHISKKSITFAPDLSNRTTPSLHHTYMISTPYKVCCRSVRALF